MLLTEVLQIYITPWKYHWDQDIEHFLQLRRLPHASSQFTTLLITTILNSLPQISFVYSWIQYKSNPTVYSSLCYFGSSDPRVSSLLHVAIICFSLLLGSISLYTYTTLHLYVLLLMQMDIVSRFFAVMVMVLYTFYVCLLVDVCAPFYWINTWEQNCWIIRLRHV